MTLRRDLRHGSRIGRAEFVRSVREYLGDWRRVVGLAVVALFLGANLLVAVPAAYLFGRTADTAAAIPFFAPAATLLPAGLVLFAALRTLERVGGVEAEALLLTTVHPRALVLGLVAADVARLLLWFGAPVVVLAVAVAAGLGAPTLLLSAGLVSAPIVACTAIWGYAVGIGLIRVVRHLPGLRRLLKVGGLLVLVGVVFLSQVATRGLVVGEISARALLSAVSAAPLSDYVALAFVGTPLARPVSSGALAVLAGWLALTPVGLAVAWRQAVALWSGDASVRERSARRSPGDRPTGGGFSPPRPFAWSKTGRIAWGVLVRAVRHPQDLGHLLVLLFLAGPLGGPLFRASGDGRAVLVAGTGVVLGAHLSGAAFGLNPLGDDRPQLPLTLLAETAPEAHLRGRVVAGLAVGLPVATGVPLLTVAGGTRPLHAVAFATAGAGLCLAAPPLALGLGCAYPIYEKRELWGTETVTPSTLVMGVYSVVVVGGTLVGLVLVRFSLTGALAPTVPLLVGIAFYTLATVGVPAGSYLYARRRYRGYVLD